MNEEWHITVEGDPFQWRGLCAQLGIKPLWIELNNFERQLMCAASFNPLLVTRGCCNASMIEDAGFKVIRVKHEVQPPIISSLAGALALVPGAIYYECHVKLDGHFLPQVPMSSRDLFRQHRWYVTKREAAPFDPIPFVSYVQNHVIPTDDPIYRSTIHSWEYESAVQDTCPGLDASWLAKR